MASRLGMKLISISRAIGSKKKPESLSLPNTAGIMSEKIGGGDAGKSTIVKPLTH